MKRYQGIIPQIIELNSVSEIDQTLFREFECGDKIIIENNKVQKMYIISKISETNMSCLSYDKESIEEISFKKVEDKWQYDETFSVKFEDFASAEVEEKVSEIESDIETKSIPSIEVPEVLEEKTYTLKLVNGVWTAVEDAE